MKRPNEQAHLPGPLGRRRTLKTSHAAPVRCSALVRPEKTHERRKDAAAGPQTPGGGGRDARRLAPSPASKVAQAVVPGVPPAGRRRPPHLLYRNPWSKVTGRPVFFGRGPDRLV